MNESTAQPDLASAILTVRKYGSGSRRDLALLAAISSHVLAAVVLGL